MASYQRLPQDDSEIVQPSHSRSSTGTSSTSRPRQRRLSRPELPKIDLRDIQDKFKAWLERVKSKKKVDLDSRKEIAFSVFEPAFPRSAYPAAPLKTLDHEPPMTKDQFDGIVGSVKEAILDGVHPKMIAKGSSGSYFARAKDGDRTKTVGVFKPKDEEPYGRLNPKTTKWLHRKFRWIIPFGRSCLIPNLSYISEAAASLMDTRLQLNIVPRTELVSISSPSFFYDWLDRVAYKQNRKPLPDKIGSFQFFLHGYTDSSVFLREHPWPGRSIADTFDQETHRTGMAASKRIMSILNLICGKTGEEEDDDDLEAGLYGQGIDDERARSQSESDFYWSLALQNDFRLELEKLIILDYIIRNTDRGADNYMIKYCNATHDKTIVDQAPTRGAVPNYSSLMNMSNGRPDSIPAPLLIPAQEPQPSTSTATPTTEKLYSRPHMHIAAIDNSLSFPHEHPKGWRSFTYGWLYLPVSLIGRPFSEQTRRHFLPLLSSKTWWEETTYELRKLFAVDPDFHPKMFARQMAVIKGQAWNVLQSLKHPDEGPLELTRRVKVLIWDDEIKVGESFSADAILGPLSAGAGPSTFGPFSRTSPTRPRRLRSVSTPRAGSHFPPAPSTAILSRSSSDFTGSTRPVPFSSKFASRVNPAATGVSVLEHMERLDKAEEGLKKLGRRSDEEEEEEVLFEEEEETEGTPLMKEPMTAPAILAPVAAQPSASASTAGSTLVNDEGDGTSTSTSTAAGKPKLSGLGAAPANKPSARMSEDGGKPMHVRWASHGGHEGRSGRSMDVSRTPLPMGIEGSDPGMKTVIAERVETVEARPFFSCW